MPSQRRPPRIQPLSRNYPLGYRVRHRKGPCEAGEPFGDIGWCRLVEDALRWQYWKVLPEEAASTLTALFEELDGAQLVDDGTPDAASVEVTALLGAFDALFAFVESPPVEWRHESDVWDDPVIDAGDVRELLRVLRPHAACGARVVFLKSWHW